MGLFTYQWLPVYTVAIKFLSFYALMLFIIDLRLEAKNEEYLFESCSLGCRLFAGIVFCILITLLGANQENAFIYFQF